MNSDTLLARIAPDRYEVRARWVPTFLAAMPVLLVSTFWAAAIGGTLPGLLATGVLWPGVMLLLTNVVRMRGREVERRLGGRVGHALTARMLSHLDDSLHHADKAYPSGQYRP